MREEIICAGSGGQGIVSMGKLLAWAAPKNNKFVTYIPSYGAEMRGGTANCSVIISDSEIASPLITNPNSLIVMNNASLDKFEKKLKKGGLLIMNSSIIDRKTKRKDIEVLYLNATEIAEEIEQTRIANMVAIGAYIGKTNIVPLRKIEESLPEVFKKSTKKLLNTNIKALRKGYEIGEG